MSKKILILEKKPNRSGLGGSFICKASFKGIIDCARACLENGIDVGLGTDTGCDYVTHYNTWMELQLFHKYCGVSNAYALYAATKKNAGILGLGEELGTIEPGKYADLIVTKRNPINSLSALKDVCLVMANGKLCKNPKVRKFDAVEREIGKHLKD